MGQGERAPATPNGNPILPPKWAFGVLFASARARTYPLLLSKNDPGILI
jgi:hypothetical protein